MTGNAAGGGSEVLAAVAVLAATGAPFEMSMLATSSSGVLPGKRSAMLALSAMAAAATMRAARCREQGVEHSPHSASFVSENVCSTHVAQMTCWHWNCTAHVVLRSMKQIVQHPSAGKNGPDSSSGPTTGMPPSASLSGTAILSRPNTTPFAAYRATSVLWSVNSNCDTGDKVWPSNNSNLHQEHYRLQRSVSWEYGIHTQQIMSDLSVKLANTTMRACL